jgi:hypothetical protein
MTLFLLPCAAVATAFFLRKRLSARRFALLLAVFLVPTMLNESKGALVLAPIVLLTVFFVATERGLRLRNMLWSVVALTAFLASAVVVYDRYKDPNSVDESVVDFFTDSERMQGYLDRDAQVGDGGEVNPGKLGSLRHALTLISRDPVTLIFGVGMGNLSLSKLGPEFEGAYVPLYRSLIGGSLSVMIGEFGLLGVGLLWVIYWLVFRDCLYVARRDPTIFGTLALGWTGAVVALFLGLGLAAPHSHVGLSMLFWYFSGLVVAQRARLEAAAVAERAHARRAPVPDPRGRQTTATT